MCKRLTFEMFSWLCRYTNVDCPLTQIYTDAEQSSCYCLALTSWLGGVQYTTEKKLEFGILLSISFGHIAK